MRRPDFSLEEAIIWFLNDKPDMGKGVAQTTIQVYASHLKGFTNWLAPDRRTLASVEPELVDSYVRFTSKNPNTRMNKMIALKSFARYLADKKIWYAGPIDARTSVLRECVTARPSSVGMPAYTPDEVKHIERSVSEGLYPKRYKAVIEVERHGFRSKEVRLLLLKNCVLPTRRGVRGHFAIETEDGTKRGTAGVRIIPMSDTAKAAILDYLRTERPAFRGSGPEPLFLSRLGTAFTHSGWHSQAQDMKRLMPDVAFKQHRLRPTRARDLHEAGWTDSDIMEALGWKSVAMLRRYVGRVSLAHLATLPEPMDRRAIS